METDVFLRAGTTGEPRGDDESLLLLLSWREMVSLSRALHWYCLDRRPGSQELPPGMWDDVLILNTQVENACDAIDSADHFDSRYPLFPAHLTVRAYRICSAVLPLHQESTRWRRAKHSLQAKLAEAEFAVAIIEASSASV